MSDADGWIEHDGKGMPVDGDAKVLVRFRDGVLVKTIETADYWSGNGTVMQSCWLRGEPFSDIIAYKVVS